MGILNQTQQKYSLVVLTKCCISAKCSSLLNSVSYYRKTHVNINFCLHAIFVAFYNIWSFKYNKISNIILLAFHYYLQPMLGLASSIWNKRTECIHFEMQLIFNNYEEFLYLFLHKAWLMQVILLLRISYEYETTMTW